MFDKEFKHFKKDDFETYEFTRFIRSTDTEFYFIVGINDRDQFDEYWDGRSSEVLGYLVSYIDPQKELLNYIYLIEDEMKNDEEIIRYTKQFVTGIYSYTEKLEFDFVIKKTNVYQKSIAVGEQIDFVKRVVKGDLPEHVFTD